MALLDVPATKSALLALRRQLSFALEGYSLLDQKRELLLLEQSSRATLAARARGAASASLATAFSALREAQLSCGTRAVDRAALAPRCDHRVEVRCRKVMGLEVVEADATIEEPGARFGFLGTPAAADAAARAFAQALPLLADLAAQEASLARVARELQKTLRRCNALSKKVIPDCRQTIAFLAAALEERERESFVVLKRVRDRLAGAR